MYLARLVVGCGGSKARSGVVVRYVGRREVGRGRRRYGGSAARAAGRRRT